MTPKNLGLVRQPVTTFHSIPFLTVHFCYTMQRPSLHPHCKLIPVGCISDWRFRFKARRPGDRVPSSRGELNIYQKWTRVPPSFRPYSKKTVRRRPAYESPEDIKKLLRGNVEKKSWLSLRNLFRWRQEVDKLQSCLFLSMPPRAHRYCTLLCTCKTHLTD